MAFFLSPGVNVSEIDLTTVIPAVSASNAALVGQFAWGPCNKPFLMNSESDLVNLFGFPNNSTYPYFMTAASFLAYGRNLNVVRVVSESSTTAYNAASITSAPKLVQNDDVYDAGTVILTGCGDWIARYPGLLGNSIRVSMCPSASAFNNNGVNVGSITTTGTLAGGTFGANATMVPSVFPGSYITVSGGTASLSETKQVVSITAGGGVLASAFSATISTPATVQSVWQYASYFSGAPGTSLQMAQASCTNDEMHVIVVDANGGISGVAGTILESYPFLSKAGDAQTDAGETNYYKDVINRKSKWIRWANHAPTSTNWGQTSTTVLGAFTSVTVPIVTGTTLTSTLGGGVDVYGSNATAGNADLIRGWLKFLNPSDVDVSLLLLANANATVINYVNDNIATVRKDCIVCCSPSVTDVLNAYPNELSNCVTFRNTLSNSSYIVIDSGWKKMYDRYNDVYRWVPLNGDIGGLMARTDYDRDAWWSPAGLNRGQIKNIVSLAWNPNQSQRDTLYSNSVNPVVSFPGQGNVLWGDKTNLTKPSAFDRINVRRLFIVLEKAIATAAKYSLFEFNDDFTRAQFKNMVEPFLRDVQGRRGIYDFRVVCDETNNTAEVIDRNQFVGDIYIKPARSINFIQLNFIAVRSGVAFEEIVGKF